MVCLAGTLLSGGVIDVFSDSLKNMNLLVLFIPAIMAMGGNSGIQTSTVTVRNMAIGHIQAGSTFGVVLRELRIACMMGVLLGLLVYVVARVWIRRCDRRRLCRYGHVCGDCAVRCPGRSGAYFL